uniref:Aspergillus nuclease S1 n=1 Tax=Araucaria cunninghamii TaxID=56994 RepID=A0A0D6R1Z9_ARACU
MAKISFILLLSVVIALASAFPAAQSWGKEGHTATCKIAQDLLNDKAADAVNKLLPDYAVGNLSSVCSWADEIKFRYRWSSQLHYINTPDNKCNFQYSRDCHDDQGEKDRCVAGAINNYTAQLESSDGQYNLTEALLFLSHFMGDIHQPLHVGFTGDEGGNTIDVHWYRQKQNLHHVWDSSIIETAMKDYYDSDLNQMIEAIQQNLTDSWSNDVPGWEKCSTNETACPNPYATESIRLACDYAYKDVTENAVLSDDYFHSRLPIVEEQLAKGGVRLAATLNRIF